MSGDESDRVREYVEALQDQVTHLKISTYEAREESSAQVKARIEQAKADAAAGQEPARDKAGQAGGRAHGQWQSMKADAAAKMQGLQDRMDRKSDQMDAKMAEDDAEGTEADALDALSYAKWAVEQAELAVLDAIDARAWADERAAASQTS